MNKVANQVELMNLDITSCKSPVPSECSYIPSFQQRVPAISAQEASLWCAQIKVYHYNTSSFQLQPIFHFTLFISAATYFTHNFLLKCQPYLPYSISLLLFYFTTVCLQEQVHLIPPGIIAPRYFIKYNL